MVIDMNIKMLLKNYNIKLYQLSQILFLSRPTLKTIFHYMKPIKKLQIKISNNI